MKTFIVTETRPATYYWEYKVEAETAEEALDKVLNGDVEANDSYAEEDESEDSDYEIIEE
jgi:hypothetical protein